MYQPDISNAQKLLKVRRLEPHEFASYRDIRLEGLKNHPEAFSASLGDRVCQPCIVVG